MTPRSCDTMVALGTATRSGQTLFAKNSDRPVDECQPLVQRQRQTHPPGATTRCQFVELPQAGITYRHVGSRPYWCWSYEHGFNEHQVVIGNEGLASKWPEFTTPKLVGMEVLRLGLERGQTAASLVAELCADGSRCRSTGAASTRPASPFFCPISRGRADRVYGAKHCDPAENRHRALTAQRPTPGHESSGPARRLVARRMEVFRESTP